MKLVIAPHNDDEVLWTSFTIQREHATVLIVYDSFIQPSRGNKHCGAKERRWETIEAMTILGVHDVRFLGISDMATNAEQVEAGLKPFVSKIEAVWAPAYEVGGHEHHNAVGLISQTLFGGRLTRYLSYTRDHGKSRGEEVLVESGEWITKKLKSLACYQSQIENPRLGCQPHFLADLREYYA